MVNSIIGQSTYMEKPSICSLIKHFLDYPNVNDSKNIQLFRQIEDILKYLIKYSPDQKKYYRHKPEKDFVINETLARIAGSSNILLEMMSLNDNEMQIKLKYIYYDVERSLYRHMNLELTNLRNHINRIIKENKSIIEKNRFVGHINFPDLHKTLKRTSDIDDLPPIKFSLPVFKTTQNQKTGKYRVIWVHEGIYKTVEEILLISGTWIDKGTLVKYIFQKRYDVHVDPPKDQKKEKINKELIDSRQRQEDIYISDSEINNFIISIGFKENELRYNIYFLYFIDEIPEYKIANLLKLSRRKVKNIIENDILIKTKEFFNSHDQWSIAEVERLLMLVRKRLNRQHPAQDFDHVIVCDLCQLREIYFQEEEDNARQL